MNLQNQLEKYNDNLLKMLKKVTTNFELSKGAIASFNKQVALDIIEADDFINHLDESINLQATTLLSLMQPVAKDLRAIVAGIKISSDLERLGDYSKNIAKYLIRVQETVNQEVIDLADILLDTVLNQLNELQQLLVSNDIDMAYQIVSQDDNVDKAFVDIVNYLEAHLDHFSQVISFLIMLRSLERAGDHIKNICESVIYKSTGQFIDFG